MLLAAFWYVVQRTSLGRAQRACEQDRRMAALLGVDVDRTISLTFVIGAALAAVAGLMFMIYYGVVNFNDGFMPGVKAFTAAVLGGIGSLPGAVLGGLLIGLIETLWSAYFSIDYKDVATFSILAITLDVHALRAARQAGRGEGVRPWSAGGIGRAAARSGFDAATRQRRGMLGARRTRSVLPNHPLWHRAGLLEPHRALRAPVVYARAGLAFLCRPHAVVATAPATSKAFTFPPLDLSDPGHAGSHGPGSARCFGFPALALALAGPSGAIKWVDNFGVQILDFFRRMSRWRRSAQGNSLGQPHRPPAGQRRRRPGASAGDGALTSSPSGSFPIRRAMLARIAAAPRDRWQGCDE